LDSSDDFWKEKVRQKNEKRYSQQADSSAIRFLQIAEAFYRVATLHVHTEAADFVSR
jgi:hypothetical protein